MKKPETNSSEKTASPAGDARKKPVSGPVIDSHPVPSGGADAAARPEASPMIESTLVGDGSGPAAAAPRSSAAKAPASEKAASEKAAVEKAAVERTAGESSSTRPADAAPSSPPPNAGKPSEKPEARVVEVRRGGFAPTFLGGVVAAGLGAAGAWYAIPHLPAAWQPPMTEAPVSEVQMEAARTAAVEAATAAARAEIQAQGDVFASRASEAGADAARQALADAGTLTKTLEDQVAALQKTVAELGARPVSAPIVSGEDSAGLQTVLNEMTARLSAQQQRLDELSARPASDPATAQQLQDFAAQAEAMQQRMTAAADAAEQRLAATESQAKALAESAEGANRRAQAATAAAALQAAIETGGSRDQALADLRAAGLEPAAVLTGDVPTLDQLRADFPAAAREGLAEALKQAQDGGALGAIGNFLRVQTGARSVEPREGGDADAILSRADAAVKAGDIKGALAEIAALPPGGQQAMSAWTARAQTWTEAHAALATLAAGSM